MEKRSAVTVVMGGLLLGLGVGLVLFRGPSQSAGGTAIAGSTVTTPASPALEGSPAAPIVGVQAPDFTLMDLEGQPVQLSQQRGRTVLLNFWATWCEPCRVEMPLFQEVLEKAGSDKLQVLAVNSEPAEEVAAFQADLGLTFPLLLDPDGAVQRLYRVFGYPTTFVIDSDGVVRAIQIGVVDEVWLERALRNAGMETR